MAANVAAPTGFHTVYRVDAAVPNYAMAASYPILYSYTTKIAFGDPVYLANDGTLKLMATAGTTIEGIFRGCKFLSATTGRVEWFNYWPGVAVASTTVVTAYVDNDPNMLFTAQIAGSAILQAAMGLNMDITTSTSGVPGAAPAGISTCSLTGTAADTATLPFRLVSIVQAPGPSISYNPTYDNQWVRVQLNTQSNPTGVRQGQV